MTVPATTIIAPSTADSTRGTNRGDSSGGDNFGGDGGDSEHTKADTSEEDTSGEDTSGEDTSEDPERSGGGGEGAIAINTWAESADYIIMEAAYALGVPFESDWEEVRSVPFPALF
jgi:hypothetical protein